MDYTESTRNDTGAWPQNASEEDKVPSVESDPLELAQKVLPPSLSTKGVLDTVSKFFEMASFSLVMFSGRMKIEVLSGEMNDVLERIHYDCLEARSRPSGGVDPSKFPRKYDRIHMSNIP